MKKLVMFAAALIMAVSFSSCTSKEESSTTTNTPGNTGGGGNNTGGGNTQSQSTRIIKRIIETSKSDYYGEYYCMHTFEYDAMNRISNWTSRYGDYTCIHTYSYDGNGVHCYTVEDYGSDGYEQNEAYITLNAEGYAIRVENFYNTEKPSNDCDEYIDIAYKNGYIQNSNECWPVYNQYQDTEFTWENGNLAGVNITSDEDGYLEYTKVSYKYALNREAVPVNINLAAFINYSHFYDWNASMFFYGRQSKNPLTQIDDETMHLSSGYVSRKTCAFDYEYNSDGTIAGFTAYSDEDGGRRSVTTTYDIVYY